jgi:uncharacterized Zn finger protein
MPHLTGELGNMWTHLDGVPCPSCKWMTYTVILRSVTSTKNAELLARCSRCGKLRAALGESASLQ